MFTRVLVCTLITLLTTTTLGQKIDFIDQVKLDIPYRAPVRLMPDGKQVIWVDRDAPNAPERKYAYFIADIDGRNKRKLVDSTIDWDDLFGFSFGHGMISPSGEKIAVMTTHNGQPFQNNVGGKPILIIIDPQGKELHRLTTELGMLTSPLFINENTLIYCDSTNPDAGRDNMQTKLQRMDLTTGKVETIKHFRNVFVTCLQLSPDRKRIAGVHANLEDEGGIQTIVHDLASGASVLSFLGRPQEAYYDDAIWYVWSGDSRHVFTARRPEQAVQLIRISPDAPEDERVQEISLIPTAALQPNPAAEEQRDDEQRRQIAALIEQLGHPAYAQREAAQKQLIALGKPALPFVERATQSADAEIALRAADIARIIKGEPDPAQPQRRSSVRLLTMSTISDDQLSVVKHDTKPEGFAVHTTTGKVIAVDSPLLIIDRVGDRVLLADLESSEVRSATIRITD